jgi:6-phosphogluconolactonase
VAGALKHRPSSGNGRLFVLPDAEGLARAAAGRLWGIVRERADSLAGQGTADVRLHVALSGGRTPRRTYELLSSDPYRDRFPWDLVHFYETDERWVPPDDPMSNRRMLAEALLSRAPVPAGSFHGVDTRLYSPEEAAHRYETLLRSIFRDPRGGFPRFDAVLLGIGADGHTASIFPGAAEDPSGTGWVAAASGGDPPTRRVTLTLGVLNAAAQVIFLVGGGEKAAALRGVLAGDPRLPAARVAPVRGRVTYLADAAAAPGRNASGDEGGRR